MWWDWDEEFEEDEEAQARQGSPTDFDFFAFLSKPKDYYKILEVDYDATEDAIRSNFIRLALKWHPDKKKEESATSRFQEINEAYKVLSDPVKRREYDEKGVLVIQDFNAIEFLKRHKGLILTCNGLGIRPPLW
ncbi:chaperone protein DnaJ-like [Zingiber officinale]|uniref:chaperone protein DnaJ-like n=1 Tax=Zingiber officinale TaxID=94328 RepID=UPI001C4B1187|nr:chaperone protein DnaJ-like [Zingiber officinale]XP_042406435.1 chaperone protein DnaJ-like [Zingiber officinale]